MLPLIFRNAADLYELPLDKPNTVLDGRSDHEDSTCGFEIDALPTP